MPGLEFRPPGWSWTMIRQLLNSEALFPMDSEPRAPVVNCLAAVPARAPSHRGKF
jgi:hypothetical protein